MGIAETFIARTVADYASRVIHTDQEQVVPESRSSNRTGKVPRISLSRESNTSLVRTGIAALLVLVGIAWLVVYVTVAGPTTDGTKLTWMGDLGRWNYAIGFGLIFVGLAAAAHRSTPLGRGRGVVIGMLGCFLIGLLWICTFYVFSNNIDQVPVFNDLGQFNLVVGIAFMAVGFTFATHWE